MAIQFLTNLLRFQTKSNLSSELPQIQFPVSLSVENSVHIKKITQNCLQEKGEHPLSPALQSVRISLNTQEPIHAALPLSLLKKEQEEKNFCSEQDPFKSEHSLSVCLVKFKASFKQLYKSLHKGRYDS